MVNDLDRDSPVPLYQQLAAELRRRIAEERLTRLPSWRTLCEQYDVSRPVAEQAVGILKDAGEVFTVNGKGTYVAQAKLSAPPRPRTVNPYGMHQDASRTVPIGRVASR